MYFVKVLFSKMALEKNIQHPESFAVLGVGKGKQRREEMGEKKVIYPNYLRTISRTRLSTALHESIFLSKVEGRGFHVEGEANIFFSEFCFLLEKVIIDAINVIKTNKKNLKNKWRVNIF